MTSRLLFSENGTRIDKFRFLSEKHSYPEQSQLPQTMLTKLERFKKDYVRRQFYDNRNRNDKIEKNFGFSSKRTTPQQEGLTVLKERPIRIYT